MQSNLATLSYSRNCHFHWMVHRVTRMWHVMVFHQISHAAKNQ